MPPRSNLTGLTPVDLTAYLSTGDDAVGVAAIASSLRDNGCVVVRDERVDATDSAQFLDMMERYFAQPREIKMRDARPHLFYQVGVTPDFVERARDNSAYVDGLDPEERPISDTAARKKDPKWRFFWRVGERPNTTDYPELNATQVVPDGFRGEWEGVMDRWGGKLVDTVLTVAEMLAIGLGLGRMAIREKMLLGPHLLAPTGSDMAQYGSNVNQSIAAIHYDLNCLTCHGAARFPGLYIWTSDGRRMPVVVPKGMLLIQAGIQLEYLTGGFIQRGMHEVVVSEETVAAAKAASSANISTWRVSSTMFGHVRSDASLEPLGQFRQQANRDQYPNIVAGDQVQQELKALELAT